MSSTLLKAVLDACVLFRATLRDTLLRAAEEGLYEVYWSDIILEEVSRNLVETGTTTMPQTQRLIARMRTFFPNATVGEFESLIPAMTNDQKDRHVLAAAVKASARLIVTSNLRDFPEQALAPFNIEAKSPDKFLIILFEQYPDTMMRIITQQAAHLRKPPQTLAEVLAKIAGEAPQFAAAISEAMNRFPSS